jgi:hypothetical protein
VIQRNPDLGFCGSPRVDVIHFSSFLGGCGFFAACRRQEASRAAVNRSKARRAPNRRVMAFGTGFRKIKIAEL